METTGVSDPVSAASARIDGYWFQDGVNEIGMGISMLSGSAVAYMVHTEMATGKAAWTAVAIGLAGAALGFTPGIVKKALRERFSYPRIGYLSEKGGEPLSRRRRVFAVAFVGLAIVLPLGSIMYLMDRHEPTPGLFGLMRWLPFVAGPFQFGGAFIDYERFKLPRLMIAGFLIMIAGFASATFINAAFLPWAVFGLAAAIIQIVSGTSALVSLVRTVPIATE